MPTHCRSQQKGGYAGRSFAPGSPRGDPAMTCRLSPVWSAHSPPFGSAGVPPSSCPPAPAPRDQSYHKGLQESGDRGVPDLGGSPSSSRQHCHGSRQQVSAALLAERLPELFTVPVFATCPAAARSTALPLPSPPPGRGWPPPAASRDVSLKETVCYLAGRAATREALRGNRGLCVPSWRIQSGQAPGRGVESRGRPRGRAISAQAQPGRRLRGREGKFLYVNGELPSGPSGSRPLPRRARGPLPPLPNRLKPLLARAGGWGSRLGTPGRSRLGSRGSPSRPEGKSPRRGWRTWGGLLGHFETGRLCSSSLTFFSLGCSSPRGPLGAVASARRTQGGEECGEG